MPISCPRCQSTRIGTINCGRKVAGTIGTAAGSAGGVAAAITGAKIGGTVGIIAGPPGGAIGTLTGAMIGGLVGGITGGTVGIHLGEVVDHNILDNHRCLDCGHKFSVPSEESPPSPQQFFDFE